MPSQHHTAIQKGNNGIKREAEEKEGGEMI
jgi:hypothetical protein